MQYIYILHCCIIALFALLKSYQFIKIMLNKKKELLLKLKRISQVYAVANEKQKERLMLASEGIVCALVEQGYDRDFVVGLLVGGKDFVDSLFIDGKTDLGIESAEIIF